MSCQFLAGSTVRLSTRAFDDDGQEIPQELYSLYIRPPGNVQLPTINGAAFIYNAATFRYEYYYTPMTAGRMVYRFDVPIITFNTGKEAAIIIQPTVFAL